MNKNIIVLVGTVIVVLLGSLILGESVANQNYMVVSAILGSVFVLWVVMALKLNIWILIPAFFGFGGRTQLLPLPLSISNLVVVFVFVVVLSQVTLGLVKVNFRITRTDFLGILCLGSVGVTFLLQPVGLSALGSDSVGSRPYFEIALGLLGFFILTMVTPDLKTLRKLPVYMIIVSFVMAGLTAVAYVFIDVGSKLQAIYSGFAPHQQSTDPNARRVARLRFVVGPFKRLMLYAMARPNAWRGAGMLVTIMIIIAHFGGAMMTGHRLALINWVAHIGLFIIITRRFRLGFLAVFMGFFFVGGMYGYHHAVGDLPLSAQRVMTVIPGDWDAQVVRETKESTEWRIEMWEQALFREGMIENKWLGDGFSYSASDLELLRLMQVGEGSMGGVSPEELAQYYLITGDLHSGPISTIKHIGFFGVFFVIMFLTAMAVGHYRLCVRNSGKPLWIVFMFFGIPAVWEPVSYVFLYGDFKTEFAGMLVSAGLLKLLLKAESLQNQQLAREEQG